MEIATMQQLITPQIIEKIANKLKTQGIELDDIIQQRIEEYKEFYDAYHEKFAENKKQKFEEEQKKIPDEDKKIEEDKKPSLKQKLAQFLKKNSVLMNIKWINSFVNNQLDILPEAQEFAQEDTSRKKTKFFDQITERGTLKNIQLKAGFEATDKEETKNKGEVR